MREAARVSKVGLFALVRKRTGSGTWFYGGPPGNLSEADAKLFEERREHFRKIGEKYGYDWETARRSRRWMQEDEILERYPPDDLEIVSDITVNQSIEETIARFEKGGFSFIASMPGEMRKEIIEEMRSNSSWTSRPRREVYQIALWKSETLR
jgi:hypothetical protein